MKTRDNSFDTKRRSFLKLSGLLGLGAVSTALLPTQRAEALLFNKNEYKVTKTRLSMGTFVAITAIHDSRDQAEQAIGLAFDEIDRLSALLTHFESSSAVGTLNQDGRLAEVPAELEEVMSRALYLNHQTGGAFDITVKPLIDLYKDRFAAGQTPSEKEIAEVLSRVDSTAVQYRNRQLHFAKPGMGVTLDGIAKGYIVDKASEILRAGGVANHLINAGGDIRTSGSAEKGKAWTVAIQDPAKKKQYPDIVTMTDGAIATSGNYEIYYDQEKMFHHIVNSRTGHSPQLSASVTVIAPSVMDADALATSVYVMEPLAGIDFINRQVGCEALVIDSKGSLRKSAGWQA